MDQDHRRWCCLTTAGSIEYGWGATVIWKRETCTQAGFQHCTRDKHDWAPSWQIDDASLQEHVKLTCFRSKTGAASSR